MTKLQQYGLYKGQGKHHEEIVYTTALIYSVVNHRIANYLKEYDLTIGKLNILIAINHHGGEEGINQVELSKHLIVTPSNMTKMIDKLEREGLVTRSALPGDRRVNIIKATKKTNNLLDKIWDGFQAAMKDNVKGLNETKQKQLSGLLTDWFDSLEK